ncbi:MFS transporter [Phytoactinopolyspora halotolerans]|uniref:MFS transporter n=1 Tax=Phytoactinopolyspora halotolerans TaxID=1981512 RepID=A0A6L9S2D5_9ACTN|nr:MFS transporter [Phytoactinopolyspora halotolerans]NED98793.1 MFS transporter [Phytoactinopolyspora halotolerans]
MTTTAPPRAGVREWIGLAVLALPAMLVIMDLTVLHLAVPHLSADLQPSSTQLLWITDIYGFLIAGFLITMGSLGDRIGRRRLLFIGSAAFGIASVLAAYSTSPEMLIATRALLGVAGATLMPSTLSLIRNMFLDPQQRTTAISVWAMSFMVGGSIGPLVGGALLDNFWWGSVFLLGVPVMVLLLVVGPFLLPEYRSADAGRLDLVSALLLLATTLPVIYGIKELAKDGWAVVPVVTIAAGIVVGVGFLRRQRRLDDPLIDVELFRNPSFSVSLGAMTAAVFVMMGLNLFVMQYLQLVYGLSPWRAGLWVLPSTVAGMIGMMLAPVLVRHIRPAFLIATGLALGAVGVASFLLVDAEGSIAPLITGASLMAGGFAPAAALGTDLIIGATPPERAGAASAVSETSQEFGGALGLAILGSIGVAVYRNQLSGTVPPGTPDAAADASRDTLAGAVSATGELPTGVAEPLLDAAQAAFTAGFHTVAVVSAALMVVVSGLMAVLLRHLPPHQRPTDAEVDTSADEQVRDPQPTSASSSASDSVSASEIVPTEVIPAPNPVPDTVAGTRPN